MSYDLGDRGEGVEVWQLLKQEGIALVVCGLGRRARGQP